MRQVRWLEKLQDFDIAIEYLPGNWNNLADALSRQLVSFTATSTKASTIAIAEILLYPRGKPITSYVGLRNDFSDGI